MTIFREHWKWDIAVFYVKDLDWETFSILKKFLKQLQHFKDCYMFSRAFQFILVFCNLYGTASHYVTWTFGKALNNTYNTNSRLCVIEWRTTQRVFLVCVLASLACDLWSIWRRMSRLLFVKVKWNSLWGLHSKCIERFVGSVRKWEMYSCIETKGAF